MFRRLLFFFVIISAAFATGGCAFDSRGNYEEMEMPLQTGSVLHRHVYVPTGPKKKSTTKKTTKEKKEPKPDAEPSATPKPEEESTPPPDRFR